MQLDPNTFLDAPAGVALVLAGLLLAKPLILAPLVRFFGQTMNDSWRVAVCLAQGGEFGLLVVSSALVSGLFPASVVQPVLGGLILSMAAAPVFLHFNRQIAGKLSLTHVPFRQLDAEAHIAESGRGFDRHVIICGYGRLGQNLMQILTDEGIPALALDLDPERIRQASAAGEPVLFGNAVQPGILRAAGIDRARALAVTMDDAGLAERIVGHVRGLGSDVPVLVRSRRGRDDERLIEAGATIFPEGLETSLAFAGQLLIMLDVPPSRVIERLSVVRAENYAPLRAFFHDTALGRSAKQGRDYPERLESFIVTEGHYASGRTPQELHLEDRAVELIDVRHGAIRVPGRLVDTRLRAGDVLVLKGDREALEEATAFLMGGVR
jgi:CPA2 family monovalent cation:H+ antiporter-2